ncbi:kinase-like domain-containing protein [Irpex rosettiformis]|uniref:Kinase-like domain-containing protein n=1 Tax=Irpex rosettiformis TaxID=378272 RepID=A0ACB8U3B0_9APHY|nr:kinase-like domain-containing protein [Irpex rosettiformis]
MPKVEMPDMSGRTVGKGQIKLLNRIGRGSFGTVYNALDMTTTPPTLRAVKVVRKMDQRINNQYREMIFHNGVSKHENIVTFHRAFQDIRYLYIVLDFCPGGDMWGAIAAGEYWKNDELVRKVLLQLIDALEYCHSRGIYHRDLKPNNILVGEEASEVYISDFGLASPGRVSQSFGVGTTQFRSPECNNTDGSNQFFDAERNDIWALGVIFATIIGGRMPWHKACENDENYVRHMRHPHYLRQVLPISLEANFILQRMFHPCSEFSPTLNDVRLMVNATKTFFMDDKEIRRSRRLQYIADKFAAMRLYVEAAMNSDSESSLDKPNGSAEPSKGLHSQSLAALEEGRLKPEGTPAPKPFIHGMLHVPDSPPLSTPLSTRSLSPIMAERTAPVTPPQPFLTPLMDVVPPPQGTSSTINTSKDYNHRLSRITHPHHTLLRLSRSVRTLFKAERTF